MEFLTDKTFLITIGTALVAVVGELYRRLSINNARILKKLDECEESHRERDRQWANDHELREKQVLDLTARLYRLEGEHEGIRNLARQVIQVVTDITANNQSKKDYQHNHK